MTVWLMRDGGNLYLLLSVFILMYAVLAAEYVCCRLTLVMPLLTPKRAIKAVFIISAVGFIMVDVSILLRDDDASTNTVVSLLDTRNHLDSVTRNLSASTSDHLMKRQHLRLLHQIANTNRRNYTNASSLASRLPRIAHMRGNLSAIKSAMLEANRWQNIANLDVFDLVASDSAVVIVVQVHNRTEYLRHLVSSLRKAVDIDHALLVFSHDFYSDELNDIVASIDFCPVRKMALLLLITYLLSVFL